MPAWSKGPKGPSEPPRGPSPERLSTYAGDVNTIHLTDAELEMARHGMTAYLRSFGHDEADTVVVIKAVLARLAAAQPDAEPGVFVG
jgi:hypothetical protein